MKQVVTNLDSFSPRDYQIPLFEAFEEDGYKKGVLIWPRRAGKDITAWNLMIRAAFTRVGVYFMIYPTYAQGKKIVWDTVTTDSRKFLDYIPKQLISSVNSQEMKIRLKNGSLIQVIGSDNIDSIVGTNPIGIIFSEYALQDPRAYAFMRPILSANGGWVLFISTPRGKNHMYTLYNTALEFPDDWFVSRLTIDDTKHIPLEEIEKERKDRTMSDDLIMQEFWCSFDMGVEGSYYSKYLDRMKVNNQLTDVPWEVAHKVHTSWDLGMRDSTTVIFFQCVGTSVRIIDTYQADGQGLEHYAKVLQNKPYLYGKHIAPHDINVRELGTGMSRFEKARQLGISFTLAPAVSVIDGIESVRSALSRIWIDKTKCRDLINALESYRKEYDPINKIYKAHPLHDDSSHFADAMRYMCISLPRTTDGMTPADVDRIRNEALYGGNTAKTSRIFNDER